MSIEHNIYIHVPFCISKCNYCAFFSTASIAPDWESYTNGILKEIDYWANKLNQTNIPTIFFGGGTPSLMPVSVFNTIIKHIAKKFNLLPDCEITLESNPGTINKQKLDDFIACGMTRLSVGIQSLDDDTLKFMGRRHDTQTALNLLNIAKKKNIKLNADFIYGLPDQSVNDVIEMCNKINALELNHVSMYELTIEPSTPFGKMNLNMPSNDTMADMYIAIGENLNLKRYEVSNYANKNNTCKHNENVWDGGAYIGLGNGAAGRPYIDGQWYEQLGGDIKLNLTNTKTRATEKILTGLRTTRGVLLSDDVRNIISMDFIKQNPYLININNDRLSLTDAGMLVLDSVLLELVK